MTLTLMLDHDLKLSEPLDLALNGDARMVCDYLLDRPRPWDLTHLLWAWARCTDWLDVQTLGWVVVQWLKAHGDERYEAARTVWLSARSQYMQRETLALFPDVELTLWLDVSERLRREEPATMRALIDVRMQEIGFRRPYPGIQWTADDENRTLRATQTLTAPEFVAPEQRIIDASWSNTAIDIPASIRNLRAQAERSMGW